MIKSEVLISVIMPAFNSGPYIERAIKSILDQTYSNFELIIIDDSSSDDTILKVKGFDDPRIILLQNDKNEGIVYSLNKGISVSKGLFIARMDSDDISVINRLELQIGQFLSNTRLVLCGTWYNVLFNNVIVRQVNLPISDNDIKKRLVFHNPFCHPSVMFKRELWDIVKYKRENVGCEDYAFWLDCEKLGEFYNIPKPLLLYRVHNNNVSLKSNSIKDSRLLDLFKINIQKYFGINLNNRNLCSSDISILLNTMRNDKVSYEGFIEYLLNYKLFKISHFFNYGVLAIITYIKLFVRVKINNLRYRTNIYWIERGRLFNK